MDRERSHGSSSEAGPLAVEAVSFAAGRDRAVATACDRLGITQPEHRQAVADAYEASYQFLAPLVVKSADEMCVDFTRDLARDPAARIVFVGRDGGSLARATERLEPELYQRHCAEVVLSRRVVEAAVQDLERNTGRSFPEIDGFRGVADQVDPADIPEAKQRLDEYLLTNRVPIGKQHSTVILVDSSYKGTIQECLAAIYPQVRFEGRYLSFGAAPGDPHPDTKRGYLSHREVVDGSDGRPVPELREDTPHTFASQDAIAVIEDTLHGRLSSPRRITSGAPEQSPQRSDPEPLRGLNPHRVMPPYADPQVREAAKDAMSQAVADLAGNVRAGREAGKPWKAELAAAARHGEEQVRDWVTRQGASRELGRVLDSFVRRADKRSVVELANWLREVRPGEDYERLAWQTFDELDSYGKRQELVRGLRSAGAPATTQVGEAIAASLQAGAEAVQRAQRRLAEVPSPRAAPESAVRQPEPVRRREDPDDQHIGRRPEGPARRR